MVISDRLRAIREQKDLSQGDIEERTDGEAPPEIPSLPPGMPTDKDEWGSSGEPAKFFKRLRQLLGRVSDDDRKLIMHMTFQLVRKKRPS